MEKPVFFQTVTPPPRYFSLVKTDPYLIVDTSLYPPEFQAALLTRLSEQDDFPGLDAATDGLLIHSDNFQALNLLQVRYREQVKCIYIDPPYNTGDDGFLYKDNLKDSSWISMFENRLAVGKTFLNNNGLFASHMDEHEHLELEYLIKLHFGEGDLGKLIWDKRNPKGDSKGLAAQHEYIHFATCNLEHLKTIEDAFSRNKENAEKMLDKATQLVKKYGITDEAREQYKYWLSEQKNLSGGEKSYNNLDENGDIFRPVSMAWPNKKTAPDDYFVPLIHPKVQKPCPVPSRGWRNPSATMKRLLEKNLILFGADETTIPNRKYLLKENLTENFPSLYYMGSSDDDFFNNVSLSFENPKPVKAASYFLQAMARPKNSLILDYFAGSGTTAHAVINLNREDGGKRKYILVEQAEYFNTVLKPRVQKVIYSKEWKDGKPQADGDGNFHGVPQIVKVLKLESYEDTLNNLQLNRTKNPKLFEDGKPTSAALNKTVVQDYLLHYMLDIESRDSLLSSDDFRKPFDYRLNIASDSAGAYTPQLIDLVETFNYLLGLRVDSVEDRRYDKGYVFIEGYLDGERVLLLWRDCERWDYDSLQRLLEKRGIKPQDSEFAEIYINGDHTLPTVWQDNDADGGSARTLKIRSIEAEFLRLMFAEAE